MTIPLPETEDGRLLVLDEIQLPEAAPEEAFDDFTTLAAEICEAPIALISIVDQQWQWIKSRVGVGLPRVSRELAFCQFAVGQRDLFVVPDTQADERFAEILSPGSEPRLRFCAGAPLLTREGRAVGTICVFDHVPRVLTERQQRSLRLLSRRVAAQLEQWRGGMLLREAETTLALANAELERRVAQRTAQLQMAVKQAETAKRQISNMVERMSDGMVALDPQWRLDYVNRKAAELIGYDALEMLGKRLVDVFPKAIGHPFLLECQDAARESRSIECEVFYEQREIWFHVRCYPSKEGISFFFQDITDRKRTEKRLKHERELSETIIASLPGTFYLFDEHGDFLRWNDLAEQATGRAGEEFRRTHPIEMIAPDDHAVVAEGIRSTFETGAAIVEARLRHHVTGEDRWHLLTGRYIEVDNRRCLLGIGIDISARKKAERALDEARSRLEVAVRASGIGFWSWEVGSDQMYLSPELRRQMGFEEIEFNDDPKFWRSRVHPEDSPRIQEGMRWRLLEPGSELEQEYRMLHRDGEYRWILSRSRLFRDSEGRPERVLGCHIDMTERRAIEEALRASHEELRALADHLHSVREEEAGRIARELHDEMGASLTALKMDLGWVDRQLARLGSEQGKPIRARLAEINLHVDGTIDSMRKVCHALRPAVLDQLGLAAAIDWQCADFQQRTGVQCAVERDDSFGLDDARRTAIFRILQELLTNVARHARATAVKVSARLVDQDLHLTVGDNGCGLPEDAFARRHSFGLVGVRERALAAGGSAQFEPSRGGGTTVKVTIPSPRERCLRE